MHKIPTTPIVRIFLTLPSTENFQNIDMVLDRRCSQTCIRYETEHHVQWTPERSLGCLVQLAKSTAAAAELESCCAIGYDLRLLLGTCLSFMNVLPNPTGNCCSVICLPLRASCKISCNSDNCLRSIATDLEQS